MFESAQGFVTENLGYSKSDFNPAPLLAVWAKALMYRAKLDNNKKVYNFGRCLEEAVLQTIESGVCTLELADICAKEKTYEIVNAYRFLENVYLNCLNNMYYTCAECTCRTND